MKIFDAYILARTKRKTRKLRTALVTLISALLFAILFFCIFVVAGIQKSVLQVEDSGYNDRYITTFHLPFDGGQYGKYFDEVQVGMKDELRAQGKKITKELETSEEFVNEASLRANKKLYDASKKQTEAFEAKVKKEFNPKYIFHINDHYGFASNVELQKSDDRDPLLTKKKDELAGKKDGPDTARAGFGSQNTIPSFLSAEPELLLEQLAPGQTLAWQSGQPYPILIPYSYALDISKKSLVGLPAQAKISGYRDIISEFTGKELTYCYRNTPAQEQLAQVLAYNKKVNDDTDATTKPLEVKECTGFDQAQLKKVGIIQDEPKEDANTPKPLFPKKKAETIAPLTKQLSFKVVGFIPTMDTQFGGDIMTQMFTFVNQWPAQLPILMPKAVAEGEPLFNQTSDPSLQEAVTGGTIFFEFANREEQKAFIATGCRGEECGNSVGPATKPLIMPFGSIKVAFEDVLASTVVFVQWAVVIIGVLAAFMLTLTIGKVISDSTKEIAVFRALGAKRYDIAQIYVTYGLMLASSALIMAVLIAAAAAYGASIIYSENLNEGIVQAVGAYTTDKQATLFSINWEWFGLLVGALFAAALIGIIIPVLANARRNLMKLMREE